jgi:hypothetical protein
VTQNKHEGEEQKRSKIKYYFDDINVCRLFYIFSLGIDHRICDDISHIVLGRERKPVAELTALKSQKHPLCSVCKAFWTDFFSLCQTPAEGVRLFPVNESYQFIYVCKFIPWWKVVHPLPQPVTKLQVMQDIPLGADPDVAIVEYQEKSDEESKHSLDDFKHDEETQESEDVPASQAASEAASQDESQDAEDEVEDLELSGMSEHPFGIQPPVGCPSFSTFYRYN